MLSKQTLEILTYYEDIEKHSYESDKVNEVLQGEHQQIPDFQISYVLSSMRKRQVLTRVIGNVRYLRPLFIHRINTGAFHRIIHK